jgi:RNA polymerase sigma-70 factor (ECF subfamily)
MKHAREFAKVEDHRAWLARTVWWIAIDRLRRKSHVSIDDTENEHVIAQLREMQAFEDSPNAEALMISGEMIAFLRTLITTLPTELRDVITLSKVDEMTSAEISAVLEISDVTVRTRLMRARQLLREKLTAVLEPSGLNGSKQHFTGKSRVKI